ncbi:MAG: DUF3842 family protein [Frisingicoccus sp.]
MIKMTSSLPLSTDRAAASVVHIESLRKQLPKDLPVIIRALGTNAAATSNMMQAGATDGATGENAIVTMSVRPILSSVWSPSSY